MKVVILICTTLLCSIASFAQIISRNDDVALMPGGYSTGYPLSHVSDIGLHNPSYLSRFNGISVGLSYQYGSTISKAYVADFNGKSIMNGLPYVAAFSFQSGDLHLALAAAQRYNLRLASPAVPILVAEEPNVFLGTVEMSMERDVHEYSFLASYLIDNLPEKNSLSFGFRLSLGVLNYSDNTNYNNVKRSFYRGQEVDVKASVYSSSLALGADYTMSAGAGNLDIGIYFEKGLEFKKDVNQEIPSDHYRDQNGQNYYPLYSLFVIEASTPDALRFDADYEFSKFHVMLNLSNIFWNEISGDYKNNLEASAGAIYKASDMLSLFFGASIKDRRYSDSNPNYFYKKYNGVFLTLGADLAVGNYTFGLSVSDSHLFSAETRRQTIARLNLGCQF